jgi:hypothetical protein
LTGGGHGLDLTGSGWGLVANCCESGDEPSGSCTMELVFIIHSFIFLQFPTGT